MSRKEQTRIVLTGSIKELDRTLLGKQKDAPDDDDKYAEYVTLRPGSGLTEHTMIYGATGSGKTRGFVKPFILQTARRKESMVLVDPKGEIYESMSAFLKEEGYEELPQRDRARQGPGTVHRGGHHQEHLQRQ